MADAGLGITELPSGSRVDPDAAVPGFGEFKPVAVRPVHRVSSVSREEGQWHESPMSSLSIGPRCPPSSAVFYPFPTRVH